MFSALEIKTYKEDTDLTASYVTGQRVLHIQCQVLVKLSEERED